MKILISVTCVAILGAVGLYAAQSRQGHQVAIEQADRDHCASLASMSVFMPKGSPNLASDCWERVNEQYGR
jgi:hypothetical protein